MSVVSDYRAWLGKANQDLQTVRLILKADETDWKPWSSVCFHSQQAAEKTLKALLVFNGIEPPATHNLRTLLTDCLVFGDLSVLEPDCQNLTRYAIITRYPERFEPDEDTAKAALAACGRIRTAILELLPAENP
jgi:HEPN domain-containing protein